jgi:hypothetical protein
MFTKEEYIYVPLTEDDYTWAERAQCVWDAPQDMISIYALRRLYDRFSSDDGSESAHLEQFFTKTLGITDCTWETYVTELRELKRTSNSDVKRITGIYKALAKRLPTSSEDITKIR